MNRPRLSLETVSLRCPKCMTEQPPGVACIQCGIVFAKYGRSPAAPVPSLRVRRRDAEFPYHWVRRPLLLIFILSLGLTLWSQWRKDQFPPPAFYATYLAEPRQTPTGATPFQVEAEGIRYTLEPLFAYELDGVVVSLHDSDAFSDIYHFKDWKDFLNIRDLCVVWGDNVSSGLFREMQYHNGTWTCWVSSADADVARRFAWRQLSNNHLLTHDPQLYEAIKSAEIGDQIHLKGYLTRYSHAGGFQRGTSVSRADTGDGACETIYVEEFRISRKANPGWRRTHGIALTVSILAFLGLTLLFFVAPVRVKG